MKKFTLLLTAALFALPSLARDFEYNGLTYTVLDEDARTCETKAGDEWNGITGNEVEGDLVIPSTVYDGDVAYSVTEIGDYAFFDCDNLASVEIPSSVIKIGYGAFYDCLSLASVEIPSSVIEIGDWVFYACFSLASVEIPSSVTKIGESAFYTCSSLTSVKIPSSVTEIGDYAFYGCSSLASVEIPSSVTKIGESAFSDCLSLASVELPSSITEIGPTAFLGCSSLTAIEIPSSVTKIGWSVFSNCSSLTSVYYGAETLIETLFEDIFDPDTYANATLYVRESALPQAETVTPWCLFANREAFDFEVGVKGVGADAEATVEVYTLDGVKVGTSTDELPTGVYVVRQGSDVRKVAVK
ncbi:MAG: leucine-rich repeat domain-containing protein [Muribaculaceae bacterium]|nr:leucine-rich repeat domain-containing protein [Muribaculaceae bacterium]